MLKRSRCVQIFNLTIIVSPTASNIYRSVRAGLGVLTICLHDEETPHEFVRVFSGFEILKDLQRSVQRRVIRPVMYLIFERLVPLV